MDADAVVDTTPDGSIPSRAWTRGTSSLLNPKPRLDYEKDLKTALEHLSAIHSKMCAIECMLQAQDARLRSVENMLTPKPPVGGMTWS